MLNSSYVQNNLIFYKYIFVKIVVVTSQIRLVIVLEETDRNK